MEVHEEPQISGGRDTPLGVALYKPQRTIRRSVRYDIDEMVSYALITINGDPDTFVEAMESLNRESWMQAMMEEMESLKKNRIWQLVDLPDGAQPIGSK